MPESIVVYTDLFEKLSLLSDKEMGVFFRAMLHSAITGEIPSFESENLILAWNFVGDQLHRDIKKYEDKKARQQENARRAGIASATARAELARLHALERRAAEFGLGIDNMTADERTKLYGEYQKNDSLSYE